MNESIKWIDKLVEYSTIQWYKKLSKKWFIYWEIYWQSFQARLIIGSLDKKKDRMIVWKKIYNNKLNN